MTAEWDARDTEIMRDVRAAWLEADPMPDDLGHRVRFAFDLAGVEVEMLSLLEVAPLAAARGDGQVRRITFSNDGLAVMVSVEANADGTVRLDGWLAPPAACQIELSTATGRMSTASDDGGRFVADRVPRGRLQLVVRRPEPGREGTVVTPAVEL